MSVEIMKEKTCKYKIRLGFTCKFHLSDLLLFNQFKIICLELSFPQLKVNEKMNFGNSFGPSYIHLYFLMYNYYFICSILITGLCWQNLGLIEESKISRCLPWRRPANVFRVKEDVRPIFWYVINVELPFLARCLQFTGLL